MSDYIRKYTGKLFSNPVGRGVGKGLAYTSIALASAAITLWPQSDDAHVKRETSAFWHPTKYVEENLNKTQPPWKGELAEIERGAEEFARLATEADLNDPITELEFRKENGYTEEQCKKCNLLNTPDAEKIREIAEDFDVDPELALAVAYQESNLSHNGKSGRPKRSKKGAYGEFQVTYKGFEEVWKISHYDKDFYYKDFLTEHSDSIEKYAHLFKGKKGKAWERVINNKRANRVTGVIFLSFNKHKENGDEGEALRNYVAGKTGKKKYPNNANIYSGSVFKHKDFFEQTCPEMESRLKAFQERRYKWHKSHYIAANQSFNQRKIY